MNHETILNALAATCYAVDWPARLWGDGDLPVDNKILVHRRQYNAFRTRIRRIAKNNWRLSWEAAEKRCGELQGQLKSQRELSELVEDELLELLREMEEERKNLGRACLICGAGHADDCELAKILA